ncbi:hypothetical protein AGMMS49953_08110 [Endomicrobiia bacterium]|uniref:LPS assembly lipoprotein LptE n=1 Tax=Endomicrobium trichonymphae TaxID=1408204 RepID=UPI00086494BA|nr:LPS assembly lipoprotein LptE [Candidatus Endomicrobium trichonymphae]BAV58882.1 putative lipoprotein [Candidatus Endomicrobium trichonymphae]GHT24796.1 hypothetical protein AGMMS49953_08110 [Endomicrobiia bacterium]
MKKFMLILALFILLSAYLISCSYLRSPAAVKILPEYIKKVYVKSFNSTKQFDIEIEFTDVIKKEIIMDGRLSLADTEEEADVVFIAIIEKYSLQPLTYDENRMSLRYKLSIKANILLSDKNKSVIWKNTNIERVHIYRDCIRDLYNGIIFYDGMSERKARSVVFNKFSKYIVRQMAR